MRSIQRLSGVAVVLFCIAGVTNAEDNREEIARAILPVITNPPATGLAVFDVEPNSQAAKAGIRRGDILTYYDGQPVSTTMELTELAQTAAREKRSPLFVLFQRAESEIQAEFDPAPLGVRLVAVREGEPRFLWRAARKYQANWNSLEQMLQEGHRWELVTYKDQPIGWIHQYMTRMGDKLLLRAQSRVHGERFNEKRDVIVTFTANPYLSIESVRMVSKDRLVLDVMKVDGKLKGERVGIPVESNLPADTVSAYLAGLVASSMPREKGSCLQCSYLESSATVAAPFADLYCAGPEPLTLGEQSVTATRYEQTVFGEVTAQFWIDDQGRIIQTQYGLEMKAILSNESTVTQAFPDSAAEFDPITQIPPLTGLDNVRAN